MSQINSYALQVLKKELNRYSITTNYAKDKLVFSHTTASIAFLLADEHFNFTLNGDDAYIPSDYLNRAPEKIAAMVRSKLKLNTSIFARNCSVRKTDKKTATLFLNAYHLLNSTQSAFNLGLYYQEELVAIASFSKGRKMNRLGEDQRSFELIRFCCKSGISVAGGLTKLIKNFYTEKKAGDVMTYVDKQLSNGDSFLKAGFKKHSETPPHYFLIDRQNSERHLIKNNSEPFDKTKFYLTQNSGNVKLIYVPKDLSL